MKLTVNFWLLLVTLFLGLMGASEGAPTKRQPKMVTFPIRSLHARRNPENVHPMVFLQQSINRAEKRLARMSGRTAPSDHELRERLNKRMYIVGADRKVDPARLPGGKAQKRYTDMSQRLQAWREKQAQHETRNLEARRRRGRNRKNRNRTKTATAITTSTDATAATVVAGGDAGNATETATATEVTDTVTAAEATETATATEVTDTVTTTEVTDAATATDTGVVEVTDSETATAAETSSAAAEATGTVENSGVSEAEILAALNATLTIADSPATANSIGLNIQGPDTGYMAEVLIGTPPRAFQILMDSGSADFWVGSENCQDENGDDCGNHQFLGPQSSSSFLESTANFQITYGTGAVAGTVVKDDIVLAGLNLPGHIFGVANLETVEFSSDFTRFDGLMGLAQSGLSNQGVPTPVEALANDGLIDKAITSYKISRLSDGKNDGEITFGGLDETKFDPATLVTVPNVNRNGFWEAAMDAVTVDGQDLGLQGRTAILDTGTTLIIAPPADAAAIHAAIPGARSDGQGGFIIPCTTTASLALNFGGRSFTIDPRDLVFLPVDINDPTGECSSGISAGQIGGAEQWLVGDTFLKNAYFSHDVADNTMSLANLV